MKKYLKNNLRRWTVILTLILAVCFVKAQPTITGFSPVSGSTGLAGSTTVIISGTNFNTTVANNIVCFGAVRATVSAATATSLTVTAPWGATWAPVSVTNLGTGLTAYCYAIKNAFIPTFTSGAITTASFAARVDFVACANPQGIAIGDIDGDGKPDLIVTNQGANSISVFRNTSTPGSITSATFATKVDFPAGNTPIAEVGIGDIDGDGKLDVAVPNWYGYNISVFRNTSTSGNVSFAGAATFATGNYPQSMIIRDIDGDGKPDMLVANSYPATNTFSVLRNTSTSGSISFATKVDISTGATPAAMAVGDIDGDGKPDVAVPNNGAGNVSVYRNTSTSGSISFAGRVNFTVGTNPNKAGLADIDGDGKADMVVVNTGSNTISVFRNTATSGSITAASFAAKVDFPTSTSPGRVVFVDINSDLKPDIIVNGSGSNVVSLFINTATSGSITASSLATKIDFTTGTSPSTLDVGDVDGDGKPNIVTSNSGSNNVSVFCNQLMNLLFYQIP